MKSIQLSFASGEVSPEMAGRIDARQYQSGAAKVLNYLPIPQGPVTRRAGSRHVAQQYGTDDRQVWLIPFVYATDEALVIELSQGIIRLIRDGELVTWATQMDVGYSGFNLTANTVTFAEEHGLVEDEAILFVVDETGALPTGLTLGTTVYANIVDSYTIKVGSGADASATLIDLTGSTSGRVRAYREAGFPAAWEAEKEYAEGDLFYWNKSTGTLDHGVYRVIAAHTAHASDPDNDYPASIRTQPLEGTLAITTPYLAIEHPSIHYAQSNDVLTLVHPNHPPRELRRLGDTQWTLVDISFGSTVAAPTVSVASTVRGESIKVVGHGQSIGTTAHIEFFSDHNIGTGDAVYIVVTVGVGNLTESGPWLAERADPIRLRLRDINGVYLSYSAATFGPVDIDVYYSSLSGDTSQSYKVTSLDANGVESTGNAAVTFANNLDVAGAYNTMTWPVVTGAARYRVYKESNGLYGYIGESDAGTFTDDNIAPDMGITPPIEDTDLSGMDYPRAVGYFEQRRCFGGTTAKPRQLWMTKSGTESDLTYSLPQQDDDRISVALAAREATTIRHIVSMSDMILLAQSSEWRLTSVNSDAITPDSVAVRQQSEIGCSDVRPLVVNNTVVFAANRGGHIRTMSFNWQAQGYVTSDLSLRASHLFDGLTIADSTYSKSPYPVIWFVSSSGNILSLTYVPEEEVVGWAEHSFSGTVESVCSIPEGDQDTLYISVKRTIGETSYRYVERIVPQVTESLSSFPFVDASVSINGLETSGRTLTYTGGRTWAIGDTVTVTASAHVFAGTSEIGDEIELQDTAGVKYRARIKSYTSSTVVVATLLTPLPTAMQSVAQAVWSLCRRSVSGLTHLEGETVQIVADGVVQAEQIVAGGVVTLDVAAAIAHVGLGYVSDLKTLPVAFPQMQGAGRGKTKNVEKVAMRVLDSAGMKVGPDAANLVSVSGLPATALATGERRTVVPGKWTEDGEVYIRQDQPLPSTVLGLTVDITMGD